jgi:SpoVK/Ycf46/Vps4 family AAA+-type ATPase
MNDEQPRRRLSDLEDVWTKRRQTTHTEEIQKRLVAFVSSLMDGHEIMVLVPSQSLMTETATKNPKISCLN